MKERIEAVQKRFWGLLAASIAAIVIGIPLGDDGATMDALEELRAFRAGFDQEGLEATLLAHAQAHDLLAPSQIAAAVQGPGVPEVRATASAPPVLPRAQVSLATLQQIHAVAGPFTQVTIGAVEPESLARTLAWRLSREPVEGGYTLSGVVLLNRTSSEQDIELEQEVIAAREELAQRRAALSRAEAKHEKAESLHDARRKWKAPWKAIVRADEARVEAKSQLDEAQQEWKSARDRYQQLAEKASAFEGSSGSAPDRGVAKATMVAPGKSLTLTVPVRLATHEVQIPGLTGAEFPVVRARGLWQELAPLSVDEAIAQLESRFSWHHAHVELGGVAVGGMTLLQLAPLLPIAFLLSVRRRSQGVGESYNPFGAAAAEALPRVGTGVPPLNLVVLLLLPLCGSLLCAWSLVQLHRLPVVPLTCAAGSVVLGVLCYLALKELSELRDAVTRSHSNPPPAPQAQAPG